MTISRKLRKRRSPEQTIRKTRAADRVLAQGCDVSAVSRPLNFTEATYYRWRKQSGGLNAWDAKKRKYMKKLPAETELEKTVLRELAEGNF